LMAYVVEHADVGMIEAGDGFGFALEALFADRIRGELLGENFDGDGAVQPRIYGAVNLSHPARAERDADLIGPSFVAGVRGMIGAIITPEELPASSTRSESAAEGTGEPSLG